MGFLDKIKKKAQGVMGQVPGMSPPEAQPQQQGASPQPEATPAPPDTSSSSSQAAAPSGPSFEWDGESYPLPQGWEGLSMEEWFYKFETVRDRMMHIDDEQLPAMNDEDGDALDPEEVLLVTQYGFQQAGHWECYRNWSVCNWAKETGESPTDCEFRLGAIARERITAEKASAMSAPGGALEPVDGVSCEAWAQIQAQIAGGGNQGELIAAAGIDPGKWERVSAEWMKRMQSDKSMTITTVYSNAFAGSTGGQFSGAAGQAAAVGTGGDLGAEPVPFETFVEIQEAQNAAAQRGEDVAAVLASFNLKPTDWSNLGQYWSKKISQEATKYHQLHTEYSAKYAAKYGNGDGLTQDQREKKVLAKVMEMAGSGQASQILAYLKDYFPDDADDDQALDWWFDTACDRCGESGDRDRAQQLLAIRYTLQEDVDEPQAEWVQSEMESLFD